ncbi:MAG: hypothetical protein QXT62_03565 [Thermoplasmata archaeon]
MIEQLFRRSVIPSSNNKIEIFTDGNDDYTYILKEYYSNINYGQIVKIRENGWLIRKEKRIIYGKPNLEAIETTDIENFNGINRERLGRLVKKTKCYSKLNWRLIYVITLFQFYWNFINEFQRGKSLVMLEELTDRL